MSATAPAEGRAPGVQKTSVPISFSDLSRLQIGRLRLLALVDGGLNLLESHWNVPPTSTDVYQARWRYRHGETTVMRPTNSEGITLSSKAAAKAPS